MSFYAYSVVEKVVARLLDYRLGPPVTGAHLPPHNLPVQPLRHASKKAGVAY